MDIIDNEWSSISLEMMAPSINFNDSELRTYVVYYGDNEMYIDDFKVILRHERKVTEKILR